MTRLTNKTALVTGGGSGIGLAVARAFLEEGARVAITGRQEARLRQAAESLRAGDRLFFYPADVAQEEQVHEPASRKPWVPLTCWSTMPVSMSVSGPFES